MNTDSNLATKTFEEIFTDTKMGNS
jgi:hypothetical protein